MNRIISAMKDGSLSREKVYPMIIGGTFMAALLVFFLFSTVLKHGNGEEGSPIFQSAPLDSADVPETRLQSDSALFTPPPDLWLQARGTSLGNAAWGRDIAAPFDTLWRVTSSGRREFFSAPALVENTLYLGSNDGLFRAVDIAGGSVLWSFSTVCGICGEAAVDSSMVFVGGQDGYLYALDRDTGSRIWRAGLGYHIFCDTGIMCDTLILTGNSMGKLCALNREDGEVMWSAEAGGVILGPVIMDTLAVFTTEEGTVAAMDPSGETVWSRDFSGQASSPSSDAEGIYTGFSNGYVRKLDPADGNVIWETDIVDGSGRCVLARPVLAAGRVLVGTNEGTMVCLDSSDGSRLWTQSFDNWIQLPPAVGENRVYISCDDQRLHLIDLESGEKLDSLEMGGYAGTAPLLRDGVLYFGSTSGEFIALRGQEPEADADSLVREPVIETDSLPAAAVPDADSAAVMETVPPDSSVSSNQLTEEPLNGEPLNEEPLTEADTTETDSGTEETEAENSGAGEMVQALPASSEGDHR